MSLRRASTDQLHLWMKPCYETDCSSTITRACGLRSRRHNNLPIAFVVVLHNNDNLSTGRTARWRLKPRDQPCASRQGCHYDARLRHWGLKARRRLGVLWSADKHKGGLPEILRS